MAEFERTLIRERVKAGLQNARKKGRRLGRPHVVVNVDGIASLRAQGHSWAAVAAQLGVGESTVRRAAQNGATGPAKELVEAASAQEVAEKIASGKLVAREQSPL